MGDFSLTTFSSKGKLLQIEYALNAVGNGETALGIKGKNCVVLAVEKKISSNLIEENTLEKISMLTEGVGVVYAGLGPDFRVLCKKARKHALTYYLKYLEPMPIGSLCKETAQTIQEYTQSGGVRPFGVSILAAGYDDDGPHLFQMDPSGAYYATAIGKNMKTAKTFLEKRFDPKMELEDVIHTALLTLKEEYKGQMTSTNIEIGYIGTDRKFKILKPNEIKDYLDEVE